MFEVNVELCFSAAHSLRGYKGKCEALHGHNWKVEATLYGPGLDKAGMVMDFSQLKLKLKEVLDKLDHCNLNEIDYFKKNNPTSEHVARYIFNMLSRKLKISPRLGSVPVAKSRSGQAPRLCSGQASCKLKKVTVWETDTSSAVYSRL